MLQHIKKTLAPLLVIAAVFSACCREESQEIARYELSASELDLIPYSLGEKVNFIHSNGYTFDFTVSNEECKWERGDNFCEENCCGVDYFSYQVKTTTLESSYPQFTLRFSLGNSASFEGASNNLVISLNGYSFIVQYDEEINLLSNTTEHTILLESITLNNKHYSNVIEKTFIYDDSSTSGLRVEKMYYNKLGLLQIKLSNNETYTINN